MRDARYAYSSPKTGTFVRYIKENYTEPGDAGVDNDESILLPQ